MRTGSSNVSVRGSGRTLAVMISLLTCVIFVSLKLVLVIKECNVLYQITTTTVPSCDNALDDKLNDASGNLNNLSSLDKLPSCFTYLTCSCTF